MVGISNNGQENEEKTRKLPIAETSASTFSRKYGDQRISGEIATLWMRKRDQQADPASEINDRVDQTTLRESEAQAQIPLKTLQLKECDNGTRNQRFVGLFLTTEGISRISAEARFGNEWSLQDRESAV